MRTRPLFHSLEILESRIAPAAVLAAYDSATGELDLSASDDDSHALVVFSTGKGTFRVEGEGTQLNGGVDFMDFTGKLSAINYAGGTGADLVTLKNLPALSTVDFAGGGSGSDTLVATELSVKGSVIFAGDSLIAIGASTKIGGDLLLNFTGNGYMDSSALLTTIGGKIDITGSDVGQTIIELHGKVAKINKGIIFRGGASDEHLVLENTISTTIGKNPTTGKAIEFLGGGGEDELKGGGPLLKLNGTVDFNGGTGTNSIEFGGGSVQIAGDLLVTAGDDSDEVTVNATQLKVTGNAQFDLGGGDNETNIGGAVTFNKTLTLSSGSDDDSVAFSGTLLKVKGAMEIDLGDGRDSFLAESNTFQVGSLLVTGGVDRNDIDMTGLVLKITGAATVDLGEGTGSFSLNYLTSATMAKTVSLSGGSSIDQWAFQGTKMVFGGDFTADLGNGANSLEFFGEAKFSGVFDYTGGTGGDDVEFSESGLTIAKAVSATLGDGTNSLSFSSVETSLLKGVTIIGGANGDFVSIDATKFTAGGLFTFSGAEGNDTFYGTAPVLALKAGLTFQGGGGADSFTLIASGTVTGDLLVDLGTSNLGDQNATLLSSSGLPGSLKITGHLTIQATTTDTGGAGYAEAVTLQGLSVSKGIEILLGDGSVHSEVRMENCSTSGGLTLNTGGGEDVVFIDYKNTFGPMTIAKITSINLGDGDDDIAIGGSSAAGSNNLVRFLGNVTVDGGTGTNTNLNDIFNPLTNFFVPGITKSLLGFD